MTPQPTGLEEELRETLRNIADTAAVYGDDYHRTVSRINGAVKLIRQHTNTAYRQGLEDALFVPEKHTDSEIAARNQRVGQYQSETY